MLRSIVVAVTLAAAGYASAVPLDNTGVPQTNLNPLGHYGLNVPVKQGLKAIAPDGWAIYVHRDATLPISLSWQNTDTWVSALQTFSDQSGLPVAIDWSSHSIYIKPVGSAAPTDAKPESSPAKPESPPAKPEVADAGCESCAAQSAPSLDSAKTLPTANQLATASPGVQKVSAARISMEPAFRAAAVAHGFSVNWASDPILLEAAPDVSGLSAEQAFRKLAEAIDGKATVTLDMVTKTVDVQPGSGKLVVKAVPPTLVLAVREGQLMSSALAELAKQAGWTLRWETDQDFEASAASRIDGADLREVLERVLPHMGLAADRYPDSKVVVVHAQR